MAIRNLLRLLVFVSLFSGLLRAQTATPLLASLDTRNSTLPQPGSSPMPSLMPQAFPQRSFHYVSSRTCAAGVASDRECRVRWTPLLGQSLEFLALEHAAIFAADPAARHDLTHGGWFRDWMSSVSGAKGRAAATPVSQTMTGAVAAFLFVQNDPRGRDLNFHNRREYWTSRLQAFAFSAAYNAQWQVGPLSRASLENRPTPAWGFAATPLAGTAWSIGEDLIDRELVWRLEGRTNEKAALLAMSLLNPARTTANLLRGHAPWYRDSRETRIAHFSLPFHNLPAPASAGQ